MDFGDDFDDKDIDPVADFLAREQSALGDLEREILADSNLGSNEQTDSFPGQNSADIGGEPSLGGLDMQNSGEMTDAFSVSASVNRIEPEKIRKWREEQKERLQEKDREEEKKKEELRVQAKQELDDWLKQTEDSIAKTKAASRNAEKHESLENGESESGNEWERIAKLCDFNPKSNKSGKDVSRMRSIYLHLKQNPIINQKSI